MNPEAQDLTGLDADMLMTLLGNLQPGGFDIVALIAGAVFGIVGFFAFMNGRKNASWRRMILGGVLMLYPCIVPGAVAVCLVGILLCGLLYFWRD